MTIKCKNWSVALLLAGEKETWCFSCCIFFLEDCAIQISKQQVFVKSFKKSFFVVTVCLISALPPAPASCLAF